MDLPSPTTLLIGIVIVTTVITCLRVIGFEYHNAVLWHNLKIEVHSLRIEQQRTLQGMLDGDAGATDDGVIEV